MKPMFVYILRCADNALYTGVTNDLVIRVISHQEGSDKKCFTYNRRPVKVVFSREFDGPIAAIAFEKQVKRWSRAKKEALISGDIKRLRELAKGRNPSAILRQTQDDVLRQAQDDV